MTEPCSLGDACGCRKIGRAFRLISSCPPPSITPSMPAWGLWLPCALTLLMGQLGQYQAGDLGAALGILSGLGLGFLLLRIFKI